MVIASKLVSRLFSPPIRLRFLRHSWRVWISLGLCLGYGSLAGLGQPSTATEREGGSEEPLGLELWLSGEEPSSPAEADGSEPDPILEPELTEPELTDTDTETGRDETSPPLAIEGLAPEASTSEQRGQDQNAAASSSPTSVPIVVIEERGTGCTLRLDPQAEVSSSQCTGSALNLALEDQWREWYGEAASGEAKDPSSPLQVGVQAIGAAMYVSPFIQDYSFQTSRPAPLASANDRVMLFPLKSWAPITSVFGWRTHPITQTWRLHTGTDLGALWGTPVVAAFSGRVEVADVLDGYGVTVVLDHPDRNQQTLYAHLSEVFVKPGDYLQQGEVLGRVGSTGNSTGPHLHFELREWQNSGWVALDAGAALAVAQVGQEQEITVLAATPQPALRLGGTTNALQQWITWFLQIISTLA